MKHHYLFPLAAILLIIQPSVSLSQMKNFNPPVPAPAFNQRPGVWLGVELRPVPAPLYAQLNSIVTTGQGLLVTHVERDSPAAKAGIQRFDILLQFEDQKLYSPGQLSRLVQATPAGNNITLQIVREARLTSVQVEPEQFQPPLKSNSSTQLHPFSSLIPPPPLSRPGIKPPSGTSSIWDNFESVMVNSIGDGRYRAEVFFKDGQKKTRSFVFEGKKDEIIQQIKKQSDLPADKRDALLNALGMQTGKFQQPFNIPMLRNDPFFNQPFFKRDPFDNSFFRQPFFNPNSTFNRDPFFTPRSHPNWP